MRQKEREVCWSFSLQDQMQLAKDTQVLAQGQDKLTNLRTPGVAKEELLAEQVRDQKRIALDQELLVQSQKRLAEDMDNAIDGKLRWERLEDYRSLLKKWQNTWGLPGRQVVCPVHVIVSNAIFLIHIGKFCSARLEFTKGCIFCLGSWTSTWWKTLQGCLLSEDPRIYAKVRSHPLNSPSFMKNVAVLRNIP